MRLFLLFVIVFIIAIQVFAADKDNFHFQLQQKTKFSFNQHILRSLFTFYFGFRFEGPYGIGSAVLLGVDPFSFDLRFIGEISVELSYIQPYVEYIYSFKNSLHTVSVGTNILLRLYRDPDNWWLQIDNYENDKMEKGVLYSGLGYSILVDNNFSLDLTKTLFMQTGIYFDVSLYIYYITYPFCYTMQ